VTHGDSTAQNAHIETRGTFRLAKQKRRGHFLAI
jgi:hypothetical protein